MMKTVLILMLTGIGFLPGAGHSSTRDSILRGALWGAGAGILLSYLDDDDDARTTIPVFAGAGALTGYAVHRYHRDDRHYYRSAHFLPYLTLPYVYYYTRYRPARYRVPYRQPMPVVVAKPGPDTRRPAAGRTNRHPGVHLRQVPISLQGGTRINISIMKLGDRYIGPQGEVYTNLPSTPELEARYRQRPASH